MGEWRGGRQGASLCGTRQVHSVSRWAALSGTALLPVPSAAWEPDSNVQAGHIPLVKALTCTSKITQPKVTAPFLPVSPLSAARLALRPARRVLWKPGLPMPLRSGSHFIYSSLQATGGKTIWMARAHNISFGFGQSAINITLPHGEYDWSHLKNRGFEQRSGEKWGSGVSLPFSHLLSNHPSAARSSPRKVT